MHVAAAMDQRLVVGSHVATIGGHPVPAWYSHRRAVSQVALPSGTVSGQAGSGGGFVVGPRCSGCATLSPVKAERLDEEPGSTPEQASIDALATAETVTTKGAWSERFRCMVHHRDARRAPP